MENKKSHFRQILLYYFFRKKSAAQATRKLREVYGDEALKERQCRNWFTRFRAGDFSLKDEPHTGRPHEVVDDEIKALIEADPHISIRELGDKLKVHFSTIDRHLQRLGYVKEHNIWILRGIELASTSKCLSSQKQSIADDIEISIVHSEGSAPNDARIACDMPSTTITHIEIIPLTSNCNEDIVETSAVLTNKDCNEVCKHKLEKKTRRVVSANSQGRIRKSVINSRKQLKNQDPLRAS